jgi:hypothetical protein
MIANPFRAGCPQGRRFAPWHDCFPIPLLLPVIMDDFLMRKLLSYMKYRIEVNKWGGWLLSSRLLSCDVISEWSAVDLCSTLCASAGLEPIPAVALYQRVKCHGW